MILLNKKIYHVVENHVIEIHVKQGTTVHFLDVLMVGVWEESSIGIRYCLSILLVKSLII